MSINILLTTMSTLPKGLNTNYYLAQDPDAKKKSPLYCDGIAQTEAGTKYFLAHYRIDHIVVIGSDKTYCVDEASRDQNIDSFVTKDLVAESGSYANNVKDYAYRFYKYRVAQFLKNKNAEQDILADSIPEERRAHLEKITSDYMRSNDCSNPGLWFNIIASSSDLAKGIHQLIDSDIKSNFISEDQYERYLLPVSNYPELLDLEKEINTIKEQIKDKSISLEKVKLNLHDRYFSSGPVDLDYEARLFIQSRRLEEEIIDLELEQYITKSKKYRDLILYLKNAVDRLIMQVQALKTNRLSRELAYIKSWLYRKMDEKYILRPSKENKTVSLTFVPDTRPDSADSKIYNISEIINTIRSCASENTTVPLDLYIDMQGGSRTDGYVRNAILSILNKDTNSRISIRKVVATDYEQGNYTSMIVDETSRYQVINLTTGMNAFIQYGRADLINAYRSSINIPDNSHVGKLVLAMVEIDHALSVCNITALTEAIASIRTIFDTSDSSGNNEANELFRVLEDGIRNDYGELVSEPEINYYVLTKWAFNKGFIQQALTIIESKMPREFVRKGICYYSDDEREKNIQIIKNLYRLSSESDRVYFDDVDNYFIKRYMSSTTSDKLNTPEKKAKQMENLLRPSSPNVIKTRTICGVNNMRSVLEKYYTVSNLRNKVNHSNENSASFTFPNINSAINSFLSAYKKALSNIKQKDFHVTPITAEDIKVSN